MSKRLSYVAALLAAFLPRAALACACGCGIFDVGTGTMMPTDSGGTAWFEYDFMNQTQNWHGTSSAPAANNSDKVLRSNFFQFGTEYMFDRDWGVMAEVPFTDRFFKTTDDSTGGLVNHQNTAQGDIHLQAVYSGFSEDMSTGVTFGLKLPTGEWQYSGFDRDSSIGSGSTDLLLGAYHMGDMSDLVGGLPFNWFVNGQWDEPFATQGSYRPGDEFDAAIGTYYEGLDFGKSGRLAPLLQLLVSVREHDTGFNADPADSGYQRLLISPGAEYDLGDIRLYGDIEVPVFQNVNGNQLVAPVLLKFILGYKF